MTREDAMLHMILRREELKHSVGDLDEDIKAFDMAIEALEQIRWIPCAERLPESCGMYIVTRDICDPPDMPPIIMSDESWFDGQNTWHNDNRINHKRGYLTDVTAWMPLPHPYKEESEG